MSCATAAVPASRPGRIHQHPVAVLVRLPPDPPKVSGLTAAAMGGSRGQGHVKEQRAAEEERMQGEGETGLLTAFDKGKIGFLYFLDPK